MSERAPRPMPLPEEQRPQLELIQGGLSEHAASLQPEATNPNVTVTVRERGGAHRAQGPAMSAAEYDAKHKYDEIADLVNVDGNGRGHISGSNLPAENRTEDHKRNRNGQFLSDYEMAQIAAHQEQIRDGMQNMARRNPRQTPNQPPNQPGNNPGGGAGNNPNQPGGNTGGGAGAAGGPGGPNNPNRFFVEEHGDEFDPGMIQEYALALNDYMKLMAAYESSSFVSIRTRLTSRNVIDNGYNAFDEPLDPTLAPGEKVRATAERVEAARQEVERLRALIKEAEFDIMDAAGIDAARQSVLSQIQDEEEPRVLREGTRFSIEDISDSKRQRLNPEQQSWMYKRRTKLYDWWQRQGGGGRFFSKKRMIGNVKKAAAIGVVALPLGIAAGAAGVFLAGPIIGGLAGGALARTVTRGWLRGKIDKGANARNVAMNHTEVQYQEQMAQIRANYNANQALAPRDQAPAEVTDGFAEHMGHFRSRNRRRELGSMAIGVAAGLGGAYAGEAIHHALSGAFDSTPKAPDAVNHHGNGGGRQPHVPKHGEMGQGFRVEHGSGEIREIQEYAAAHGYKGIDAEKATRVFEHVRHLKAAHNGELIKLNGEPSADASTYWVGGDPRVVSPGRAHWASRAVEKAIRAELAKEAA